MWEEHSIDSLSRWIYTSTRYRITTLANPSGTDFSSVLSCLSVYPLIILYPFPSCITHNALGQETCLPHYREICRNFLPPLCIRCTYTYHCHYGPCSSSSRMPNPLVLAQIWVSIHPIQKIQEPQLLIERLALCFFFSPYIFEFPVDIRIA